MKINKKNLDIVEHCASVSNKDYTTNGLVFDKHGTMAISDENAYALTVTGLTPGELAAVVSRETVYFMGAGEVNLQAMPRLPGKVPDISKYLVEKPVTFSTTISADYLQKVVDALRAFDGGPVQIKLTGPQDPIQFISRDEETGQTFTALLNPRRLGIDSKRFAPLVIEDEFEKALRLASQLI